MDQRGLAPNTDGWYLIANHGAMVVRVRPGMPLGETESGELSFDPAWAQLKLEIADDGGLVLNAVAGHQLETPGGDRCSREHVGRQRGAEIQLPHNVLQLDTDFVERAPAEETLQFRAIAPGTTPPDSVRHGSRRPSHPGVDQPAPRSVPAGAATGLVAPRRSTAETPSQPARAAGERPRLETRTGIPLPRRGAAQSPAQPPAAGRPAASPRHGGPIAPPVLTDRARSDEPASAPAPVPETPRVTAPARDGRATSSNRWIVGARIASLVGLSVILVIWYLAARETDPAQPTVTVSDPPAAMPEPALAAENPSPSPEVAPIIEEIVVPDIARLNLPEVAQPSAAVDDTPQGAASDVAAEVDAGATETAVPEAAVADAAPDAALTDAAAPQAVVAEDPASAPTQPAGSAAPDPSAETAAAAIATAETVTGAAGATAAAAVQTPEPEPEPEPAQPDPNPELVARLEAIGAAAESQAQALAQRRDLAAARLARREGRLMAPVESSAYTLYNRVLERDPDSVEARTGLQAVRQGLINQALAQLAGNALNDARVTLQAAASAGANPMLVADLLGEVNARQRVVEAQAEDSEPLYPVEDLVPVTMDPPSVPRGATGAGDVAIEVRFTVTEAGDVSDVAVLDAPPEPLAQAVQTAVREWRFEPVLDNGQPVPVRSSVRFTFQN